MCVLSECVHAVHLAMNWHLECLAHTVLDRLDRRKCVTGSADRLLVQR